MRQCDNCNTEFTPKNEQAKYCTTKCKTEAFYKRKTTVYTPVKQPDKLLSNERMDEGYISYNTLNMLLSEQEKRHTAEIERVKAEMNLENIRNETGYQPNCATGRLFQNPCRTP